VSIFLNKLMGKPYFGNFSLKNHNSPKYSAMRKRKSCHDLIICCKILNKHAKSRGNNCAKKPLFISVFFNFIFFFRMWEFMSSRPSVLTGSTYEGIQRVRESKGHPLQRHRENLTYRRQLKNICLFLKGSLLK
jgi:hypothetical protein